MNTKSYDCRRLPDNCCDHEDLKQIGEFSWRYYPSDAGEDAGKVAGMIIMMPGGDGQGELNWIPVNLGGPIEEAGKKYWGWDGNPNLPTLMPSLLLLPNQWHGFMTAGRLVSC